VASDSNWFLLADELPFFCRTVQFLQSNMSSRFSRTIYVGNLPADIRESEIEDLFYKVWSVYFSCFPCYGAFSSWYFVFCSICFLATEFFYILLLSGTYLYTIGSFQLKISFTQTCISTSLFNFCLITGNQLQLC